MNDPTLSRNVRRRINHWGRRHGNHVARTSRGALRGGIATARRGRSGTGRSGTGRSSSRTTATLVAAIAAVAAALVREQFVEQARVAALVAAIAAVAGAGASRL